MRAGLQAGLDTAASIVGCFEISPVTGMLTVKPQVAAAIGKARSDKWAAMDRSERLEFAGRGLFEVASLVIAPAKLAQLAKLDKLANGARLLDKAADASKNTSCLQKLLNSGKQTATGFRATLQNSKAYGYIANQRGSASVDLLTGGLAGKLEKASVTDVLKNGDKWVRSLSPSELRALRDYQTSTYADLNKALRQGTNLTAGQLSDAKNLESAISKGVIGQDTVLSRGFTHPDIIKKWDALVDGKPYVFIDEAFVSTTKNPSKAVQFARESGSDGIVATIKVKEGTPAASIESLGTQFFEDEAEVLLGSGHKFVIQKAWVENGIKRVVLEVK